jgi:hypothetical protein
MEKGWIATPSARNDVIYGLFVILAQDAAFSRHH